MAEAEILVNETKVEDAEAKMSEIETLDAKWEEVAKSQANLEALKDVKEVVNIEEKSVELKGEKKVEVIKELEQMDQVGSMEYRNAFLKKLQGKDLTMQENAIVTASGAIPTQTMNKIIEKMEHVAPLLSKIDLSFIPSYLSVPVDDTVNDASWVAMGTASSDSADSVTTISLSAYKLIKTIEIGADASVMAIDSFEAYLVNKLAKKMAKALENAVINGTGSSQPTGLLKSGLITNTGTYTKAGMTYTDILAIIADLPDHGYRAGASLIMPSALYYSDVLPALTDKGSGLDVQAAEAMKVLGYDVILCDRVAEGTVIFGNLENYVMNIADGVKIESDKSVAFRSGSTVYRAMALVDGKVANIAAFNVYTRALA
jgi:HK97 family phage major capsid protein